MKNKLVIPALLALSIVVSNAAAGVVYFDTANPLVLPGETISVSIFSDLDTVGIMMTRISDNGGGVASNLYLNPGYDYAPVFSAGTAINTSGVLIEYVRGELATPGSPTVSGILYSFDYTVSSSAVNGQLISIFPDSSGGGINEVDIPGISDGVTPDSLSLSVVPEPVTILLLGMGGLVLARRERRPI
jgi:hypothetical protein